MVEKSTAKTSTWVWIALVVLLIAVTIGWFVLSVKDWVQSFSGWIQAFGVWGVVIFGLVYIIAVIVLAPAGPMTIAAGLAFGAWGFPLVVIAATIGAALAFLVSRYLAREKVKQVAADPDGRPAGYPIVRLGFEPFIELERIAANVSLRGSRHLQVSGRDEDGVTFLDTGQFTRG